MFVRTSPVMKYLAEKLPPMTSVSIDKCPANIFFVLVPVVVDTPSTYQKKITINADVFTKIFQIIHPTTTSKDLIFSPTAIRTKDVD
jgi:hypothetical protein